MKGRNIFVRVVAIVLCVIMVLGVATAALYAFAAEEQAVLIAPSPDTGSRPMIWVTIAVIVAIVVIVGCIVLPRVIKKK